MNKAIRDGSHDRVAVIGIKLAGALLGVDPLISGIEAVAKGYQVGKEHGIKEGMKAAAAEFGTSIVAGGIAVGFTSGVLGGSELLNEDQKRIVSASISVALEETVGPIVDIVEGWD
jgi:hypothetical protein